MASRKLADLTASVEQKARHIIIDAAKINFDVLIYMTWRSLEEQAKLYRRGRAYSEIDGMAQMLRADFKRADLAGILLGIGSQYGKKVTNAAPGMSAHNYRLAFDAVPLRDGRPIWIVEDIPNEDEEDERIWQEYGDLVRADELTWGGNWTGFLDYPHAQEPDFNWRELIEDWDFT